MKNCFQNSVEQCISCTVIERARLLRRLQGLMLGAFLLASAWLSFTWAVSPIGLTGSESRHINQQLSRRDTGISLLVKLDTFTDSEEDAWHSYSKWLEADQAAQAHCSLSKIHKQTSEAFHIRCLGVQVSGDAFRETSFNVPAFRSLSGTAGREPNSSDQKKPEEQCKPPTEEGLTTPEGSFIGELGTRHFDPATEVWK